MEKFKVTFEANDQQLKSLGTKHASDTYADIEATFVLGEKWTDLDSVSAVWWNDFTRVATVLDSQGKCIVPHEVLERKGYVRVNLVGSVVENGELVTRLTSYSAEAVKVNEKIKLTGSETSEITPSQYEQFVANVKADADRAEAGATASEQSAQSASESATASANSATSSAQSATASAESAQNASESAQSAENAKDDAEDARDEILGMRATAETLEAGSDATASYSDGLLTLGIPRGDQGEQGIQGETGATPNLTIGTVETLEPTEDATASITGTAEEPVLNLGLPKGDTGEVSLEDLEALLPTDTASGEIVTITDGQSVVPAKSLKVALEPIQEGSGTPSPDNVRPISGRTSVVTQRTGKNLLPPSPNVLSGIVYSDGYYNVNLTTTGMTEKILFGNWGIQNAVSLGLKEGDYCWKATAVSVDGGAICPCFIRVSQHGTQSYERWEENSTRHIYDDDKFFILLYFGDANTSYKCRIGIQIELGTTATDYEPYNGTTYTTDLGQTVYGGTLDVVSGELVVDRGTFTIDGTTSLQPNGATANTSRFFISIPSKAYGTDNFISDAFATAQGGNVVGNAIGRTSNNGIEFFLSLDVPNTPAGGHEWFGNHPTQVAFELATPQTIQLTPQQVQLLLGNNNVWSDGDVTLVYNADIQLWVEKQLS